MGKSQRVKGHSFERWTAQQFRPVYPDARRDLNDTHGGSGIDLENTGTLAIQCKAYKDYAPISKIEEIQVGDDRCPVLVTKGDGKKPMAVLPLSWLIAILGDVGVAFEYDAPPL
jgi:hypothetical protein